MTLHRSSVLALGLLLPLTAAAQSTPAMQLPADQRAYNAARDTADPAQRIEALQAFVKDYPDSKRKAAAENRIFETLLQYFPEREKQIDDLAKQQVKHGGKGLNKLNTEGNVAEELAEAGPNGVDLKQASKWAQDALSKLNEPDFDKEMEKQAAAFRKETHAKPPTPKEQAEAEGRRHKEFLDAGAGLDTCAAAVDIRLGNLTQAKTLLDDAYAVDPLDEDTNSLRGQLALAQHDDAAALEDFERAELCLDSSEEGLAPRYRTRLRELYAAEHNGSDAGLTAALDAKYAQMYPAPFTPDKVTPPAAGHTVLLELFTGSACPPCVGGDLAAEGLLTAWPRKDLVVLAFDQNIPAPDPLSNPATQARAKFYNSNSTPNYVLDGDKLDIYGQSRDGAKELYGDLEKDVVKEQALPTDVHLVLTAGRTASGDIAAQAAVTTGPEPALAQEIVMPAAKPEASASAAPKPAAKQAPAKPAPGAPQPGSSQPGSSHFSPAQSGSAASTPAADKPAPPLTPHLILNFALVEDDVRYSGQNGIRFHRYVVRALAKDADSGFPLAPGADATLTTTFDPAAISTALHTYLTGFETHNDRFGPITFLTTETAMVPSHLYVAAWVQDTATHRVLASAITPVRE